MTEETLQEVAAARRRWRTLAMALVIALAGVLAVSARADLPFPERVRARTVEAEEIVLKDSSGHVRARLAVQGNTARLTMYDEDGKAVAGLPERPRLKDVGQ